MRKTLLLFASVALLLVGCQKENFVEQLDGGMVNATFTASLEGGVATRAVADNDGNGTNVNRCIMEIYYGGELFTRQYAKVENKVATFTVQVVSNRKYKVAFWADKVDNVNNLATDKYYTTNAEGGLQAITIKGNYLGNDDARDAFYHVGEYTVAQAGSSFGGGDEKIYLKRPFAQMNVITTDWDKAASVTGLAPEKVKVTLKNALVNFNAVTGVASGSSNLEYETAVYTPDANGAEKTLSMDYLFASADKAVIDIDWKALHGTDANVEHSFAAVPYQRNYRTNIKGALLTTQGQWTVTVDPDWATPEFTHPVVIATTLEEAQSAVGPTTTGTEAAGTVIVKPEAVTNRDQAKDKNPEYIETKTPGITLPSGAKAIEFVLTPQSKKDVTFELPALPDDNFYWYIRHESGYPTENLNVKVSDEDATRVIIDAPNNTHVVLNDVEYTHVIAITGDNTLIVPQGITVKKLTVKKGGVEIHGTVEELEVAPETGKNVYFRACEGLSAEVFAKIYTAGAHNYIDQPMYTYKKVGEKYDIYKLPVVAKIGKVEYPSVAAAVEAAVANDVIDVVAESVEMPALKKTDITLKGNGTTKVTKFGDLSGKNVTLDGFEFTVQIYGANGENFTIKNSKFTGENGLRYCYAKGNVLIENCVFDTKTYGIHFDGNSNGKATVKNCEITGFNTFNPCLTFEKCKFVDSKVGNQYYVAQGHNEAVAAVFKDCSFSAKWCDANPNVQTIGLAKDHGFAEINNCTFATGTVFDACKNSGLGVIAIDATGNATDGFTAGTFMAKQASDIKAAPSYIVTAVEGKENVWTVSGPYEARIGQVYYTTLQAAVDAVQTGETITLLCNIMDFPNIEDILLKDFSVDAQGSGFDGFYIKNATTGIRYYDGGKTIRGSLTYPYETLEIPEGVTATIGAKNYEGTNLKYVKLPSTMRILADGAFCKAKNLEKIYYKDGDEYKEGLAPYLTQIGGAVFQETEAFNMSIVIPEGITSIGSKTFYVSAVKSVVLPEGLISIGASGIRECSNLTEITIPASLQNIGEFAFRNCTNLKNINLLFENVPQTIGAYTFNAVSAMFGATTPGVIYVKNQAVADALWNVFDSNAKNYYSIKNYDDNSIVYYKGAKIN